MLVIIDLTVVREDERTQHHGLTAAFGQILYGESPVSQGRARRAPQAVAVGSAMLHALRHEPRGCAARSRSDDTDYAAHARQSSATDGSEVPLAIGRLFV